MTQENLGMFIIFPLGKVYILCYTAFKINFFFFFKQTLRKKHAQLHISKKSNMFKLWFWMGAS